MTYVNFVRTCYSNWNHLIALGGLGDGNFVQDWHLSLKVVKLSQRSIKKIIKHPYGPYGLVLKLPSHHFPNKQ